MSAAPKYLVADLFCGGNWLPAKDGDARALALYRRHYSARLYRDGRRPRLFVGPGQKMVLLTADCAALFVWRKFIDASGQTGVNCAVFRNEGPVLSSDLIREAMALAWARWPGERLYTYVDGRAVRSSNPGYCYLVAGWRRCGVSKDRGLVILECLPPEGALHEPQLLGRLDAEVEHPMAGRTQDPEHVSLVLVHRAPAAVPLELGTVGDLQHSRLGAPLRFAGRGQIGVAPSASIPDRIRAVVRHAGAVVGRLRRGCGVAPSLLVLPAGGDAACLRAVLLVGPRLQGARELRAADGTRHRHGQPVAGVGANATLGRRVRAAAFRAVPRALVPRIKGPLAVAARPFERLLICSHVTPMQNRYAESVAQSATSVNRELARAMGFDDYEVEYEFTGNVGEVTRQIGNAVPVNLAAALVTSILVEGAAVEAAA